MDLENEIELQSKKIIELEQAGKRARSITSISTLVTSALTALVAFGVFYAASLNQWKKWEQVRELHADPSVDGRYIHPELAKVVELEDKINSLQDELSLLKQGKLSFSTVSARAIRVVNENNELEVSIGRSKGHETSSIQLVKDGATVLAIGRENIAKAAEIVLFDELGNRRVHLGERVKDHSALTFFSASDQVLLQLRSHRVNDNTSLSIWSPTGKKRVFLGEVKNSHGSPFLTFNMADKDGVDRVQMYLQELTGNSGALRLIKADGAKVEH